jgi:hypothetical protein
VSQNIKDSATVASINWGIPEQIDRSQQSAGAAGWVKLHAPTIGPFFDQSDFVQAAGVLGYSGYIDPAFPSHFLHAHVAACLEEAEDFDPAMVGQTARKLCSATIIVRHMGDLYNHAHFAKSQNVPRSALIFRDGIDFGFVFLQFR